MRKCQSVPISSIYHGLFDGPHATPPLANEGPIFLGIKNITEDGALDLSDVRHIAEADYARWTKRVIPQEGDIVFTYEATLNRYAIIPRGFRGCLGRRLALIRTDKSKVDTRFLFHYFFSPEWRSTVAQKILTGATVDRIPLSEFPDFLVNLPPLPVQKKIAGILSAYDDLIENNRRRIQILEEMARNLYREWFVKFRFPGYQHTHFKDSNLGIIPETWKIKSLEELIHFSNGKSIKPGGSGTYKVFGANGIIGKSDEYKFENAVVIGRVGAYCGSVMRCPERFWASDNTIVAQPYINAFCADTVYYILQHLNLNSYAGGSAQPLLTHATLKKLKIAIPPDDIVCRFGNFVSTVQTHLSLLRNKNNSLCRTRDLLLPKLIYGEVKA